MSRAFTLLEMVVCLLLSAILAAVAIVSLNAAARPATMSAVSGQIISFDQSTRRIARSFHRPSDLHIGNDAMTCDDATQRPTLRLPDGYTIADVETIHFADDGRSRSYIVDLAGPRDSHRWLLFSGLSGQVTEGDGAADPARAILDTLAEAR